MALRRQTTAVAADVAAVRRKHKAEQLAEVIASQGQRYGTWVARSAVAAQVVGDWNRRAHEEVTPESRKRLRDEEARLRKGIADAAESAVRAAAEVGVRGNDDDRLRAAWRPLSTLDELAERWRPLAAVLAWLTWQGPRGSIAGKAWRDPSDRSWPSDLDEAGTPTLLGRALALHDAEVRRRLETLESAARAR